METTDSMNGLNARGLLTGASTRLRHVVRFSSFPTNQRESVAEHSYFVVLYAMLIGDSIGLNKDAMADIMRQAVVHDMEECVSGDFVRPFKYSSPALKKALDIAAEAAAEQCFSSFLDSIVAVSEMKSVWGHAKDPDICGSVVKVADFLSVVSYIWMERQTGNALLSVHAGSLAGYLQEMREMNHSHYFTAYLDVAESLIQESMR